MKGKIVLLALVLSAVSTGGCVQLNNQEPQKLSLEQACIDSGGIVETSLCCNSANDFPNLCLIGACGCSPDNSHEVKVCTCPAGQCFDGTKCIAA